MNRKYLNAAFLTLGALMYAHGARADCVDGVRDPTSAELEFAARAQAALAAALPAPIVDSERRGPAFDFSAQPRLSFCKGTPEGAFSPSVGSAYLYRFPRAEADGMGAERKRIELRIEEIEKLPPEKEAQRKQLLDQMRTAYDSAPRRSRKDPPFTPEQQAQVDRASVEGRKLEDAANKVVADHKASVKAQTDPLRAQAKRLETFPQEIAVRIAMNQDRLAEDGPQQASFGSPSARRSAGLRVYNVAISVTGPEGAARQAFFASVDRAYLKSLVGQPLPDVSASRARAAHVAAAAPVTAPAAATSSLAAPGSTAAPSPTAAAPAAARPASAETTSPQAPTAPREEPKKAEPTTTVQDAANAVNKLRGLFGC